MAFLRIFLTIAKKTDPFKEKAIVNTKVMIKMIFMYALFHEFSAFLAIIKKNITNSRICELRRIERLVFEPEEKF